MAKLRGALLKSWLLLGHGVGNVVGGIDLDGQNHLVDFHHFARLGQSAPDMFVGCLDGDAVDHGEDAGVVHVHREIRVNSAECSAPCICDCVYRRFLKVLEQIAFCLRNPHFKRLKIQHKFSNVNNTINVNNIKLVIQKYYTIYYIDYIYIFFKAIYLLALASCPPPRRVVDTPPATGGAA